MGDGWILNIWFPTEEHRCLFVGMLLDAGMEQDFMNAVDDEGLGKIILDPETSNIPMSLRYEIHEEE